MKTCNICGGTHFKEGPLGRLTLAGDKPQCVDCGSLERHRSIRSVWEHVPVEYLKNRTALQFSSDPSADRNWFSELEMSMYGGENSLDLQNIDRDDSSYDVIICNQILEHVEDDKSAFSEIIRVMTDDGFFQMTVPIPISRKVTDDWGYPKEDFHGHYRHYGIDLIEYFRVECPEIFMINIRAMDEVTGVEEFVFFWMKSKETRDYLLSCLNGTMKVEQYF